MTSALTLDTVTKRYGDRLAVDRLTFQVEAGQIVGFLGANGSGKTTTMRCVMGLASPDGGSITVGGHEPGSREALALTGALIEEPALYRGLRGRDHLRAVARWTGVADSRVDEVLRLVGLADTGSKPSGKYSLGMKQRLGLATALLKDPAILVVDEPSNGLDPAGLRDVRRLLARLRDEGRTILMSSHMLGEVEQIADRLVVIRAGRLVYQGGIDGMLAAANEDNLADAYFALAEPAPV
jgi:ABC-2 type transport system ATP-binding protein